MGNARSPVERSALQPTTHGAADDSRGAKCVRDRVGSSVAGAGSLPARSLPLVIALVLLTACAHPRIEYQPIPAWLIPERSVLPTIKAADLACLSDATYAALVLRDRLRAKDQDECRALLETGRAK